MTTYWVEVRGGRISVTAYESPAVAPKPQGYEYPLRTMAEVKSYARAQVAYSGWDRSTKRALRDAIRYLTRADCDGTARTF